MRIAIITGSRRPGRHSDVVARWVLVIAQRRRDAEFELVDIADQGLPLLDEPLPPSFGQYSKEHTRQWSVKIAAFDGYEQVVSWSRALKPLRAVDKEEFSERLA